MPRKTVIVEHVYEFTFRVTSEEPIDVGALCDQFNGGLARLGSETLEFGQVLGRELCFDEDGGAVCLMTEGHRGLHEGVAGRRWGTDR